MILTMHDISLRRATAKDVGGKKNEGRLVLEGTVKTYRYIDDSEQQGVKPARNKAAGGRKT